MALNLAGCALRAKKNNKGDEKCGVQVF